MKSILTVSLLFTVPVLAWAQLFDSPVLIHQINGYWTNPDVVIEDFDNDGDVDFVFETYNKLVLADNVGYPNFVWDTLSTFGGILNVEKGDVNNDGLVDLVVGHENDTLGFQAPKPMKVVPPPPPAPFHLSVFENQGDQQFEVDLQPGHVSWANPPYAAHDFNGDSLLDIIVSSSDTTNWFSFHQLDTTTGGFNWQHLQMDTISGFKQEMAVGDIDGDQSIELVGGLWSSLGLEVYQLEDQNIVQSQLVTTDAVNPISLHLIDIDGDDIDDLVSGSVADDKIAWYQNDGNGVFGNQNIVSTEVDLLYALLPVDYDNDEDYDLIAASYADSTLFLLENDGIGNFNQAVVIADTIDRPVNIEAGDLDGDGDKDLIVTARRYSKVFILENLLIVSDLKDQGAVSANIFPNPTSGRFTIRVNGDAEVGQNVVITDVLGRPVLSSLLSTSNSLSLNSKEVGPGFFLVHLVNDKGQRHLLGKLVVQ